MPPGAAALGTTQGKEAALGEVREGRRSRHMFGETGPDRIGAAVFRPLGPRACEGTQAVAVPAARSEASTGSDLDGAHLDPQRAREDLARAEGPGGRMARP